LRSSGPGETTLLKGGVLQFLLVSARAKQLFGEDGVRVAGFEVDRWNPDVFRSHAEAPAHGSRIGLVVPRAQRGEDVEGDDLSRKIRDALGSLESEDDIRELRRRAGIAGITREAPGEGHVEPGNVRARRPEFLASRNRKFKRHT